MNALPEDPTPLARETISGGEDPTGANSAVSGSEQPAKCPADGDDLDEGIRRLPPYSRSLLRIPVLVKVTLAETRLPLKKVLQLGPGSIIQFAKACEETLTLEVSQQPVAEGEAVKVGDKFGLWITTIASPTERFFVVQQGGTRRRVR